MPPVVVHQAKEYSQDLHHNITFNWKIHHTPYGYMDREGWLKAMIQLSIICGTSPVNNQILLLDGHDSHFNDRALTQTQRNKFSPSYLKRLNLSTISPGTTGVNQKWSLSATFQRIGGCWNMVPRGFNINTWTLSWLKYRKLSRYQLATSSGTAALKLIYPPSDIPTW